MQVPVAGICSTAQQQIPSNTTHTNRSTTALLSIGDELPFRYNPSVYVGQVLRGRRVCFCCEGLVGGSVLQVKDIEGTTELSPTGYLNAVDIPQLPTCNQPTQQKIAQRNLGCATIDWCRVTLEAGEIKLESNPKKCHVCKHNITCSQAVHCTGIRREGCRMQ